MEKRQKINVSKKAYFISVAAVLIFVIAASIFVTAFAPQLERYMRHLGTGVTGALIVLAAYRLISAGYRPWISYLVPVLFLLVVPLLAVIIFVMRSGIKSLESGLDLAGFAGAVYTIVFLVIVGLIPNKHTNNQYVEIDRSDPRNRIEPRF